jgi:hypothetical protein
MFCVYYYVQVLREGWLLKQSKKLKMWQKRYFVLDSVALYWYPIKKENGG